MTGDDTDGTAPDEGAVDAFALVGNEIRAGIIRALGDRRGREEGPPVLSFSELREAVDVEVRSSQFNYHLQQLVGRFVERVEEPPADGDGGASDRGTDGGYRMRPEGTTLYRTIRAGTFARRASLSPFEVGVDCYYCGTAVEASYDGGLFTVRCPGCDYVYDSSTRIPAGAVDDEAELLSRVDRYNRHKRYAFSRGVCPTCANALDTRMLPGAEVPFPGAERHDAYVHLSCARCNNQEYLSVGKALLPDPELVAFCQRRGLDLTRTPAWELEFAVTDRCVTVRSSDPWEVALRVALAGDALELIVDGDLAVLERTRS